jgi:DNA repair protein RecO (recombination protein O)
MLAVTDEAIVLALHDYAETDLVCTFFTLDHGKIRGIAKGGRRSRKRFGGALELFARLRLTFRPKDGLARLEEAEPISVFPSIRGDLDKIAFAGYACELTDLFLPEGLRNPRFHRLLTAYLDRLESSPCELLDRRFFEMNLLNVLGYCPPLTECPSCGGDPSVHGARFSGPDLLCAPCGGSGPAVSPGTVKLLRRSLATGRFGAVEFPPRELREAGEVLDSLVASHAGKEIRSLRFLREIALA